MTSINELISNIQSQAEWLETTEGDSIECISLENLEGILTEYFNKHVKLAQ